MICPKCGAPLPDGSTFCPNCGVSLAINQQQFGQPQQQFGQPQQQFGQPQQQFAQPQQQFAQPQQQFAQPQQQFAQPQQQFGQPQQQFGQPQQQFAQPQQQFAQPQQQFAQPQYGMPYGGMAPAKKNNTGLIIGICAGAAVVIAGIVLLIIFLAGGGGVHDKSYSTKITINGYGETFSGTYSGGWKDEMPEGNGTLKGKHKMYETDGDFTISGNWTAGKLNGDNCTLSAVETDPNNPSNTLTEEYKGKFENGRMISGTAVRTETYNGETRTERAKIVDGEFISE